MATPPPPPNIYSYTGNDPGLIRALLEWVWAFYKSTVLEGYFTTLPVIEDLVDPASATAATAQETANDALTLAVANDARLGDIQSGTITVDGASTTGTATVLFSDTNYNVVYGALSSTGTPAAGSFTPVSTGKTTTQITITVQTAPGGGNSVTFDFIAKRL